MEPTAWLLITEILALALAGSVLIHAGLTLANRFQKDFPHSSSEYFGWIMDLGWFLVGAGLLYLWPEALDYQLYPRRALVFWGAIAIFPAAIARTSTAGSARHQIFRASSAIVSFSVIAFCMVRVVKYLIFVRPWTEGPDFYYYVCVARHIASGFQDLSMIEYFYFPGVFSFWRFVLFFSGSNLDSLQWWYITVIAGNALLIGAILQRILKNPFASVLGIVWYIGFCSRFEGFQGTTEPISSLPVLCGILIWGGCPLTGRGGKWRAVALGITLGLGVYIRQQAGLLSLGAGSLLITYLFQSRTNRVVDLKALLLIPAVAAVVLIVGILLEGYGLRPLLAGIQHIPNYGARWSFWYMMGLTFRLARSLYIFSALGFFLYAACWFVPKLRFSIEKPWFQVLGFSCVAACLSLLPFFSRPHLHYGLIPAPMLILAGVIFVVITFKAFPNAIQQAPVVKLMIFVLLALPFTQLNPRSTYFFLWPYKQFVLRPQKQPWRLTPGLWADIVAMKKHVRPMENIYVLPPRQNDIHFFLGTRHSVYGWAEPLSLKDELGVAKTPGVVLIDSHYLPDYVVEGARRMYDYDRAEMILRQYSYVPVVKLTSMTLWRPR